LLRSIRTQVSGFPSREGEIILPPVSPVKFSSVSIEVFDAALIELLGLRIINLNPLMTQGDISVIDISIYGNGFGGTKQMLRPPYGLLKCVAITLANDSSLMTSYRLPCVIMALNHEGFLLSWFVVKPWRAVSRPPPRLPSIWLLLSHFFVLVITSIPSG